MDLDRAVYSLIATVLKHNPPEQSILVQVFPYGDIVAVTIAGENAVPDDERVRIFTDFYRGLIAVVLRETGVSLSEVARVVARHSGSLIVTGATIALYLSHEPDGPRSRSLP